MTSELRLSGLFGSHPLGALASFGLLRVATEFDSKSKLSFTLEDDWIATLHSAGIARKETLSGAISAWLASKALDDAISWAEDVRVTPDEYQSKLRECIESGYVNAANFLSALVADGSVDAQKGLVKPSAFYMVSGQQSFLGGMREILALSRQSSAAVIEEAVFGPWSYRVRSHSLGWDPNAERLYALRHRAPTAEKPSCVAGAVLLAFWALPMMPALGISGRSVTIGFSRDGREQYFSWPVFSEAISVTELMSLLHVGKGGWMDASGRRFRSGIATVYRSLRAEFGQGYAVLRPASEVRTSD